MTAIHDRHVTTLRRQVRISLVGSELLDGVAFDSNATFSLRCLVSQQRLTQPPPQLAEDHQYYETLGLPYEASSEEVRRAYRKAAIKYHPDKQKGGAEEAEAAAEQFRRVALAHRVLSDPQRRARYNEIITLCWEVAAEGS